MANALYGKGKEKILSAAINWSSDTIKAALVSSAYSPTLATDEFFSTISANVLNTPQTLGTKTLTLGVFDAADITFTAVTAGATAKAVVLYKDTGLAGSSPLLAYIDVITGFPLATNGGDIQVVWDAGVYKIFAI
jgi:formaldehyde-activating enzyme involved in methanogenesis